MRKKFKKLDPLDFFRKIRKPMPDPSEPHIPKNRYNKSRSKNEERRINKQFKGISIKEIDEE